MLFGPVTLLSRSIESFNIFPVLWVVAWHFPVQNGNNFAALDYNVPWADISISHYNLVVFKVIPTSDTVSTQPPVDVFLSAVAIPPLKVVSSLYSPYAPISSTKELIFAGRLTDRSDEQPFHLAELGNEATELFNNFLLLIAIKLIPEVSKAVTLNKFYYDRPWPVTVSIYTL